jgi:hypothetical protein
MDDDRAKSKCVAERRNFLGFYGAKYCAHDSIANIPQRVDTTQKGRAGGWSFEQFASSTYQTFLCRIYSLGSQGKMNPAL